MIELRAVIQSTLESVSPQVYFEEANEEAEFPYIVFNLPTSNGVGVREDFILEVDIWDRSNDTTAIDTLTQSIDEVLNRKHSVNSEVLVNFYRVNRMILKDPNKSIKRRKLTYQAKTYFL